MTSIVLTTYQLNELASKITVRASQHGQFSLWELFNICHVHGFRISEVYDLHTWKIINGTEVYCTTKKFGNIRIIPVNQFTPSVIFCIQNQLTELYKYSISHLDRIFKDFSGYHDIRVGNKGIGTHLFRHIYVKNKIDSGMTFAQLQALMGLKNTSIVQHYYESQITATIWP